jgi:hypothetical protein
LLVSLSFLLHAACPFFLESGADDLSEDTSFLRAVASSEIRNRQRLRTPLFKECAGILPCLARRLTVMGEQQRNPAASFAVTNGSIADDEVEAAIATKHLNNRNEGGCALLAPMNLT